MATMNVSLPDDLKAYVDDTVGTGAYQSSSEYVRELIRRDKDARRFRALILAGIESGQAGFADDAFFDGLRAHAKAQHDR